MKRISILFFALTIALSSQAQTYKWIVLQNALSALDSAYKDGKIFYNPTYGHFSFIENGVARRLGSNALSTSLSAGHIYVGNGSNVATSMALSGDGTLSSAGALSVIKLLGNTIPSNSNGALTNDGSGTLAWSPITSTLAGATDANISSPADAQLLQYRSSDSKWHNFSLSGDVTINNTGASTIGSNKVTNSMLAGSIDATKINTGVVSNTEFNYLDGVTGALQTQIDGKQASGSYITALTGDIAAAGPGSAPATLATVNSSPGTFGSATKSLTATVNGKGLITALSEQTVTPAVGSITGLGTGVATALGINTGSAGGIGSTSNSLTVDNSSLQYNSGTTFDGTAAKTISVKSGGVTNSMLANSSITIAGNSTSLGGSVTLDNITGLSSNGLVKRTAANTLAIATSGTDYAPATSGSSILYGNGSGGFSSVTIGNGITFSSGVISTTSVIYSSISAATTLSTSDFGKVFTVTGTSADYTIGLPTAVSNSGQGITFIFSSALTKFITLDGNSTETINGSLTQGYWAKESVTIVSDGSNWQILNYTKVKMAASMLKSSTSVTNNTDTKIVLDTNSGSSVLYDNTGFISDASGGKITVKRDGLYTINGTVQQISATTAITQQYSRIYINGSNARGWRVGNPSGHSNSTTTVVTASLSAGDYIELYCNQNSGSTVTYTGALIVVEQ